jgi:hypothetical protein
VAAPGEPTANPSPSAREGKGRAFVAYVIAAVVYGLGMECWHVLSRGLPIADLFSPQLLGDAAIRGVLFALLMAVLFWWREATRYKGDSGERRPPPN